MQSSSLFNFSSISSWMSSLRNVHSNTGTDNESDQLSIMSSRNEETKSTLLRSNEKKISVLVLGMGTGESSRRVLSHLSRQKRKINLSLFCSNTRTIDNRIVDFCDDLIEGSLSNESDVSRGFGIAQPDHVIYLMNDMEPVEMHDKAHPLKLRQQFHRKNRDFGEEERVHTSAIMKQMSTTAPHAKLWVMLLPTPHEMANRYTHPFRNPLQRVFGGGAKAVQSRAQSRQAFHFSSTVKFYPQVQAQTTVALVDAPRKTENRVKHQSKARKPSVFSGNLKLSSKSQSKSMSTRMSCLKTNELGGWLSNHILGGDP